MDFETPSLHTCGLHGLPTSAYPERKAATSGL